MTFVDLVGPPKAPDASFADSVRSAAAKKLAGGSDKLLVEKQLYGALHMVNLRIQQLQIATHKGHKTIKHGQIVSQLHDLTHYQSMLNNLAGSLESGNRDVCYQSYLSAVAHATSRIHDSLHHNPHEESHNPHEDTPLFGFMQNSPTMHLLDARENEIDALLGFALEMQQQSRDVRRGASDFGRVVLTAAAAESGSKEMREEAKTSLRTEVAKEVREEAAAEGIKMDAKAEENIVHSRAYDRWQAIKEKAAEIHEVATQHWNTRDEKIAAMREKLRDVYGSMVQPHIDRLREAAAKHGDTFSASMENINQLASSLDNAVQSFPAREADSLMALHEHIGTAEPMCDNCISALGNTIRVLHNQKDAILKAKEGVAKALKGDTGGLKDVAAVLSMDEMKAAVKEIGDFHEEHLPGIGTVAKWLGSSLDTLSDALGALGITSGKSAGIGDTAFHA